MILESLIMKHQTELALLQPPLLYRGMRIERTAQKQCDHTFYDYILCFHCTGHYAVQPRFREVHRIFKWERKTVIVIAAKWNASPPSDGLSANNGFQNNVAKLELFNLYGET